MDLTTYEKCRAIRRMIVNHAAEVAAYASWGDEYSARSTRELPASLIERHEELRSLDITELTDAECEELGFGRWSKDNPMRLIPMYLMPFLPDEIAATSINGKSITRRDEMDNDTRFGCLAYGIMPSDLAAAK